MARALRRSEVRSRRDGVSDGHGDHTASGWADVHDRLLLRDLARRQDLDDLIAAEDAAHAIRTAKWRAEVARAAARRLRCAAELLERPAAGAPSQEGDRPVGLDAG